MDEYIIEQLDKRRLKEKEFESNKKTKFETESYIIRQKTAISTQYNQLSIMNDVIKEIYMKAKNIDEFAPKDGDSQGGRSAGQTTIMKNTFGSQIGG